MLAPGKISNKQRPACPFERDAECSGLAQCGVLSASLGVERSVCVKSLCASLSV